MALLLSCRQMVGRAARDGKRDPGVGGAVVPSLTGLIARHLSLDAIPPFLAALTAVLIAAFVVSLRRPDTSEV